MTPRSLTLTRRTAIRLSLAAPLAAGLGLAPASGIAGPGWDDRLSAALKSLNLPKDAVLTVTDFGVATASPGRSRAAASLDLTWSAGTRRRLIRIDADDPETAFSGLLDRIRRDFGCFA